MQWLNEPPVWKADDGRLRVVSGAKTDFWRITHYDFVRDNGHFYYEKKAGDFTVQVKIEAKYEALYDQAGIMIPSDPANWIKAGLGHTDGFPHFSPVVTRDFSERSILPRDCQGPLWVRFVT